MLGFFLLPFKRENFVDVFYHAYSSMLSGIYFSRERFEFEKNVKLILFGISLTFYVSTTVQSSYLCSSVELSAANVCATIIFN